MPSFGELCRTGYVYDGSDVTLTDDYYVQLGLRKESYFPPLSSYDMPPSEVVAMDLEEFLMDRLEDVNVRMVEDRRDPVNLGWIIRGGLRCSSTNAGWFTRLARIQERNGGGLLDLQFSVADDALLLLQNTDITGAEPLTLLTEYAQIFQKTKQGIAAGKHKLTLPLRQPAPKLQDLVRYDIPYGASLRTADIDY
jgi:hypothetical protein